MSGNPSATIRLLAVGTLVLGLVLLCLYRISDAPIEKDPAQKTNLAADKPDVVSRLKAHYATVPHVVVDRTPNGRSERERLARQRPNRTP